MPEVFLRDGAGKSEPRPAAVKAFWIDQNHRGQAVYHFEGCASISEAERIRGLDVLIPFGQRVTLPAGKYFVSDLVGCSVFESSPEPPVVSSSPCSLANVPALVGTVSDVQTTGKILPVLRCWWWTPGMRVADPFGCGYLHADRSGGAAH